MEIAKIEKSILNVLLFPESFENIEEECRDQGNSKFLWAVLKELIQPGYVKVLNAKTLSGEPMVVDKPSRSQLFRITAKGMAFLE